jgi:prolipoprotein diacylglyceryltransferase
MGFFGGIFGLVALLCAIWVIYRVVTKHKHWSTAKKAIWIVCAIFFNIITAIVYYFMAYKKK